MRNQQGRARRVNVFWYVHAVVVAALVSVNLSAATYSPAHHPQNPNWNPGQQQQQQQYEQHQEQQQQQQQHQQPPRVHWEDPARGGSTVMAHPPQEMHPGYHEEPYEPPKIMLKHMSMALRVTSEWNRRLLNGVNRFKFWKKTDSTDNNFQQTHQDQEGQQYPPHHSSSSTYGTLPVNVHPSRPWHTPIPPTLKTEEDDDLTLFHAKAPRGSSSPSEQGSSSETARRGIARWGPELLPYLELIVELLDISPDGGVEIPLAMIYLDRACSVETPRSNSVPPCPFCTPRTVHRLSLASMLLATQAVKGLSEPEMQVLYKKFSSLGIPEVQLQQMVEWMRGALGDTGLMVTVSQMKVWGQHWESIFVRQQQQPPPEPQQQRLEHHHQHQHQAPQVQAQPQQSSPQYYQ
jgi:hypothetical protein